MARTGSSGGHLAFGLRNLGWKVIASARHTKRLSRMGFETLKADLTSPRVADPEFWRPHLAGVTHVINAAGVLSASDRICEAVHVTAPKALYEALPTNVGGILISRLGLMRLRLISQFFRRAGEEVAVENGLTILRPGLVLATPLLCGSSLMRALAALPLVTPVVGKGQQIFNPIHASDLTDVIHHAFFALPPPPGAHEVGGPEDHHAGRHVAGNAALVGPS